MGAITDHSNLQGNVEEVCGWVSNPLNLCHILFTEVMMPIMILQCSSSITHLDVCIHLSFPGESLSIMYSILLLVCFSLFSGWNCFWWVVVMDLWIMFSGFDSHNQNSYAMHNWWNLCLFSNVGIKWWWIVRKYLGENVGWSQNEKIIESNK